MNQERRKRLEEAAAKLAEAREIIEAVRDEEQDAFDNMPESLQGGERGEKMENAASLLDDLAGDLETSIETLNEAAE